MEIIYCSKCGSMIPPGGLDEGRRYLKDDEPLCPKCYKSLPAEEHDGSTMVVSKGITERLASQEPPEPDYSPKPKTSKLAMTPAKRRRTSSGNLAAVDRERAPSGIHDSARQGKGVLWLAGAGLVALVVALAVFLGPGGDRKPPAPPRRQPVAPPDRVDTKPPTPEPEEELAKKKLQRMLAEANDFRTANPGLHAMAIAKFEEIRKQAGSGEFEAKAAAAIAEIRAARKKVADGELAQLRKKAADLVAGGDYDGALGLLGVAPKGFESELKTELAAERARIVQQADSAVKAILDAAELSLKNGQPEKGLVELDKAGKLKYGAMATKLDALRKRFAQEKANVAEMARRRKIAQAAKRHEDALVAFEEQAAQGLYALALEALKAAREGIDAETAKLMPPGLEAAEKLGAALVSHEKARRKQLSTLAGRNDVELQLATGRKLKCKIEKVDGNSLHVSLRLKAGVSIGQVVKLSDLAPGALSGLLPAPKLEGAEAHLAAAIDALADGDLAAARKLLPGAGEHVLFGRWSAWLEAELRKRGLGTVVTPTPGPATTGGAWRGTWTKLPGEALKGMRYLGSFSAAVDPKRNQYVLITGDFRVFAYGLAKGKWGELSKAVSGDGKSFPAPSVNASAIHDAGKDGIYFNVSRRGHGSGGFLFFDLAKRKWTSLATSRQPGHVPLGLVGEEVIRYTGARLERFDRKTGTGAGEWKAVACGKLPPRREYPGGGSMTYDSRRKRFLLFSGNSHMTDTWVYDPVAKVWKQLSPVTSPSGRQLHSMCYDSANDVVVLHGGKTKRDTWVFGPEKNSWTELKPEQAPTSDVSLLQYDPTGKRLVACHAGLFEAWTLKIEPGAAPVGGQGTGLLGEYFNGKDFQRLAYKRLDAKINVFWAASPAPGVKANAFSVRWTGFIRPPQTGTYKLYTVTDDGARLWVDGKLLINDWRTRKKNVLENSVEVRLEAGKCHPIRMEYFDEKSTAIAKLFWSGPGIKGKRPVEAKYLFPPAGAVYSAGAAFLEKDGLVVMYACNATSRDRREDKPGMEWTNKARPWAFVSTSNYVEQGQPGKSAMLGYAIRFTRPGDYYVWMFRRYQNGKQNSCFVEFAGKSVTFDDAGKGRTWGWFRHPESFKVTAGDQQLTISRREGGYRIHKIVLTDKADYRPSKSLRESPGASTTR